MTEFMWLPRRLPIPDGWIIAPHQTLCHHHVWSILIMKVEIPLFGDAA